jgi:hypothetical protein
MPRRVRIAPLPTATRTLRDGSHALIRRPYPVRPVTGPAVTGPAVTGFTPSGPALGEPAVAGMAFFALALARLAAAPLERGGSAVDASREAVSARVVVSDPMAVSSRVIDSARARAMLGTGEAAGSAMAIAASAMSSPRPDGASPGAIGCGMPDESCEVSLSGDMPSTLRDELPTEEGDPITPERAFPI